MAQVTLSFDNGPDKSVTPVVLDILAAHDIKASFFVVGEKLIQPGARALAERAKREGHWIANHTFTHTTPLGQDPDPDVPEREIGRMQREMGDLTEDTNLFRPFGGGGRLGGHVLSRAARDFLLAGGYTCVLWNSVPRDWEEGDGWLETAMDQTAALDWSLVVLHDIPGACVDNLDDFITRLKARDVVFRQEFPPDCVPMENGQMVRPEVFPDTDF